MRKLKGGKTMSNIYVIDYRYGEMREYKKEDYDTISPREYAFAYTSDDSEVSYMNIYKVYKHHDKKASGRVHWRFSSFEVEQAKIDMWQIEELFKKQYEIDGTFLNFIRAEIYIPKKRYKMHLKRCKP